MSHTLGKNHTDKIFLPRKEFSKRLKLILGYRPRKLKFYQLALIHKSAANKIFQDNSLNNERLEFLGDAILDSVTAEHLYNKYPEKDEGFLTQMRSKIVNRDTLKHIALKMGIGYLVISKMQNDNHKSIYGDALEALIGALYLDRGYRKTQKFIIERLIGHHISLKKLSETESDFKSRVIEWGQKNKKDVSFDCQEQADNKSKMPVFISHLFVKDEIFGMGLGTSKKEAEQNAAKQALQKLDV